MADQKNSNATTSASVKEFITWVSNDWQTQTASEATKTVFGTGTGLAYDGFAKAATQPTGWVAPFNRGAEEAAKAAKIGGTVMKSIGIGLGVSLDLGEAASLASQGKTDEALCKVVSAAGGVVGGLGGGAIGGPGLGALTGYGGSKAAEYICRKISDLSVAPQAAPQETSLDYSNYPSETINEANRLLRMGGKATDAAKKGSAAAEAAEKQERGNRLLSQSIISAANYTNLSLQQQMEQKVDTSNQSLSEVSRLARAESSATAAKAATDAAAASQAAAAAAQAARDAFRASETEYTNSQSGSGSGSGSSSSSSSSNSGWSGWSSGSDQSSAESARLSRSGSTGDPIFIDLDGNGIELYSRNNSPAQFDFDDDGYAETTAWAGPQDGILVIDEGNDNNITQSKEIAFAKWTAAEGDTDLEGLAATFDSNHDGVLDAQDARYADFKVWKDANSNGVVDTGEMQTLAQAGIKSFNLKVKDGTKLSLEDGSVIHGLFDIQRADGKIIQGADVSLAYNDLGYRTRTDAAGNTVVEFESGSALHYRNIGATEGNANFHLGTDTDAKLWVGASGNAGANVLNASSKTTEVLLDGGAGNDSQLNLSFAIKSVAARAIDMGARGRFDLQTRRNAVNDEHWRAVA